MPIPRHIIPSLGVTPRSRSTFILSAPILPPEVLMDGKGIPRWLGGVTFQQLGCDPLARIESILCGDFDQTKDPTGLNEALEFDTFAIYDAKEGSIRCIDQEILIGDIAIRYPSMVSEQIAAELMEGGARPYSAASPATNPSLASSAAVISGGPYSPGQALALLEQAAADTLHGAEATIHMTPRGFSSFTGFDVSDGIPNPTYRTAQGHVIIADAGYTGPTPDALAQTDAADEWWYVSGPVFWALTKATPLGMPQERFDIASNMDTEILEAFAIVVFDPCAVVAVPVTYDDAGGGGTGLEAG